MDPVRSMLLALAQRAQDARLRWHAGRAATRARGEIPGRIEAFAHHVEADLCLLTALHAAGIPANFRVHDITLSRDPVTAAEQLREIAFGHDGSGPIEADHEPARLAYRALFAAPLSDQEQRYVETLANLPDARRDKVIELAEDRARHREKAWEPATPVPEARQGHEITLSPRVAPASPVRQQARPRQPGEGLHLDRHRPAGQRGSLRCRLSVPSNRRSHDINHVGNLNAASGGLRAACQSYRRRGGHCLGASCRLATPHSRRRL